MILGSQLWRKLLTDRIKLIPFLFCDANEHFFVVADVGGFEVEIEVGDLYKNKKYNNAYETAAAVGFLKWITQHEILLHS